MSATILVVDDVHAFRELVVEIIASEGYRVLETDSAEAALEILSEEGIDLVLTDVVMPGGMNGFEVADQALAIDPKLKVLLATGYASGGAAVNRAALNRYPMLRKPYSLEVLAQTLRTLLE